jgi:hypothetical protein
MFENTGTEIKVLVLVFQSLWIFFYIFGSAMLIPKMIKKMPFWLVAIIMATCGFVTGLVIFFSGQILTS